MVYVEVSAARIGKIEREVHFVFGDALCESRYQLTCNVYVPWFVVLKRDLIDEYVDERTMGNEIDN